MRLWVLVAAMLLATPAAAQRTLEVPATSSWKHAETGLVLRPTIIGLARTKISDLTTAELDIAAQYGSLEDVAVTLYLFRPALLSVPVWFDRAETQIMQRDIFGNAAPQGEARAFAPPGATIASALRRPYLPNKAAFKSTALAVIPVGDWLVTIRISSRNLDSATLDSRLSEVIEAIGWPKGVAESTIATPVVACTNALAFSKKAKLLRPKMEDSIFGALIAGVGSRRHQDSAPTLFCRDGQGSLEYGVYRQPDSVDSYTIAINDAGRVVSVYPALSLKKADAGFTLSLSDLGKTMIYPNFNKLPAPDVAWKAVRSTAPVSSTSRQGNNQNIELSVPK